MRRCMGAAVLLMVMGLAIGAQAAFASGPTFTVSGLTDGAGSCNGSDVCTTLRAAITAADLPANTGATIDLDAGDYTLNNGLTCGTTLGELPKITQSMTITGAGAGGVSGTTISQTDGCSGVFDVEPTADATVTISDLEVTGGKITAGGGAARAGALFVYASATVGVHLTDVEFLDNSVTGKASTISGSDGSDSEGGAIVVAGAGVTLDVSGCSFTGNTATGGAGYGVGVGGEAQGGAILDNGANLTVESGTTFTSNEATGGAGVIGSGHSGGAGGEAQGGAIWFEGDSAQLTVTDTTFMSNSANGGAGASDAAAAENSGGEADAGAIYATGPAALDAVTLDSNYATGGSAGGNAADSGYGYGGAVEFDDTFTVEQSTFADNGASMGSTGAPRGAAGGGLDVEAPGTGKIVNSTFDGNYAVGEAGSSAAAGGGLHVGSGPVTLASDTFDSNDTTGFGGNLSVVAGTVQTTGTIFADGEGILGGGSADNCSGTVTDLAPYHNLEYVSSSSTSECGLSATHGDLIGIDPMLASGLANNGGLTETLALEAGSPAIGADPGCINPASPSGTAPLTLDQRGLPRTASDCDIGAYQTQSSGTTAVIISHVSQSHRSWRLAGKAAKHQPPVGTTFKFTLNEVASVKLTFAQILKGHRTSAKTCSKGAPKGHGQKACALSVARGSLSVAGKAGANSIKFTGRIPGHKRLQAGTYTVTFTAKTATGSHQLKFTIVASR